MSPPAVPSKNGTPTRVALSVSGRLSPASKTRFAFYQGSTDNDPDAITATSNDMNMPQNATIYPGVEGWKAPQQQQAILEPSALGASRSFEAATERGSAEPDDACCSLQGTESLVSSSKTDVLFGATVNNGSREPNGKSFSAASAGTIDGARASRAFTSEAPSKATPNFIYHHSFLDHVSNCDEKKDQDPVEQKEVEEHTSDETTDNPYKAAIRDVLHLLRARVKKRSELAALSSSFTTFEYCNPNRYMTDSFDPATVALDCTGVAGDGWSPSEKPPPDRIQRTPPPQFQPGDYVLAMRTPDPNVSSTTTVVLERVSSDPTRGQVPNADLTQHIAFTDATKPCDSSILTEETHSIKKEEWKVRRARMANYAARLQQSGAISRSRPILPSGPLLPPAPLPLHPSERTRRENSNLRSERVLRSASRSTSRSGSNMRGGHELLPASKGDNRLLSPAVDLRKAVEENDYEMFRPTGAEDFGGPELGLANPVLSQTLSDGCSAAAEESDSAAAAAMFTRVPSSPAPGLENRILHCLIPRNTTAAFNALSGSMGDESAADKRQLGKMKAEMKVAEARKVKLDLERWRREEEVELGVERVLLAILELADKRMGGRCKSKGSCNSGDEDDGDPIEKAFAALFTKCDTTNVLGAEGRVARPPPRLDDDVENAETAIAKEIKESVHEPSAYEDKELEVRKEIERQSRTPVIMNGHASMNGFSEVTQPSVSEPLAPPNSPKENADDTLNISTPCSTRAEYTRSPRTSLDLCKDEKDDASVVPFDDGYGGVETVRGISELVSECLESNNNDSDTQGGHHRRVLGRLNKKMGGTTGVVLDSENESNIDDGTSSPLRNCLGKKPKSLPSNTSILNPLTSVVMKAPNEILPVFSIDESSSQQRFDRYSNDGDVSKDDDAVADKEANAAMRMICAHLFPYGVDKVTKKTSGWGGSWLESWSSERSEPVDRSTMWDNEDPEETGYQVHRVSKDQLRRIEREFEGMINKVRENSEQRLLGKRDAGRFKTVTEKPKVFRRDLGDDDFQRNLEEAEKLLDRVELRREAEEKAARHVDYVSASDDDDIDAIDEDSVDSTEKALLNSKLTDPLALNPNFPLAKPAGTGNVGELEIYHLPIIYKARQTGFEPTKDLVLQPGTVIAGQYFVQNELGSAAFSTAYRCVNLNSPKMGEDGEQYHDEVCLKVIKNTKDFFDQSLDEIKILELLRQTGQCHDNNIIEMKTFFYYKEHLVIAFELLRQNLFEFGKFIVENDEPPYFTRERLCYITRQCLVALNCTHKMGLVHSDIKPENILLSSYSRAKVKVIDFGSSCYLTDRQSSYVQSRSYRAPEVVLGLPYSGEIDVWSLGCVVAEMYTGQVVFQNDSVVSMLSRIESICGTFPRHMIAKGRQSSQYFTRSGLLYEKVKAEDEDVSRRPSSSTVFDDDNNKPRYDCTFYNIYQPKSTTMAARLGFAPDLLEQKRTTWEEDEKALFVDFVRRLLTIDPETRPSAEQALEHPWILSGFNLSEQDIKYPPE